MSVENGGKSSRLTHATHTLYHVFFAQRRNLPASLVIPSRTMHHRLVFFALVGIFLSCSSPAGKKDAKRDTLVIGGNDASEHTENLYEMPTPNELFQLVKEMSGEGQKRMMSPANTVDRYLTTPKRALNFGVYATDLVYASTYKITSEVVRYYLTCKKLGDDLGLSGSFSDKDFVRLERNLAQGDSLDVISNDAYERAYRKMQDERMDPTLALVLAGGWVESMHLVSRQVLHFDAADPLVVRVAEQKPSLDHLIDMMAAYKSDTNVTATRMELIKLRDIYDTFPVIRTPHKGASTSGRMVLGDDVTIVLTPEGFKQLSDSLEALRENIIKPEDLIEASPKH